MKSAKKLLEIVINGRKMVIYESQILNIALYV